MGKRSQTHCVNGHEFTPENTTWRSQPARRGRRAGVFRQCRACHNECSKFYDTYKRRDKGGEVSHVS